MSLEAEPPVQNVVEHPFPPPPQTITVICLLLLTVNTGYCPKIVRHLSRSICVLFLLLVRRLSKGNAKFEKYLSRTLLYRTFRRILYQDCQMRRSLTQVADEMYMIRKKGPRLKQTPLYTLETLYFSIFFRFHVLI